MEVIQVAQRRKLFSLLELKKDNPDIEIRGLNRAILSTKAEMQQEDVAWVEKMIAEI